MKSKKRGIDNSAFVNEFERNYEAAVRKISDVLCTRLANKKIMQCRKTQTRNSLHDCVNNQMKLEKKRRRMVRNPDCPQLSSLRFVGKLAQHAIRLVLFAGNILKRMVKLCTKKLNGVVLFLK